MTIEEDFAAEMANLRRLQAAHFSSAADLMEKVAAAKNLLDGASAEFTQNADGIVLKVPPPGKDETDRVIVLIVKGH